MNRLLQDLRQAGSHASDATVREGSRLRFGERHDTADRGASADTNFGWHRRLLDIADIFQSMPVDQGNSPEIPVGRFDIGIRASISVRSFAPNEKTSCYRIANDRMSARRSRVLILNEW